MIDLKTKAYNDLLEARKKDSRPLNPLTVGQLWQAMLLFRSQPEHLIMFLLHLLLPDQDLNDRYKFLASTIAFSMPSVPKTPMDYQRYAMEQDFSGLQRGVVGSKDKSDATPLGGGRRALQKAQDDALKEIVATDPEAFVRRARTLSNTAEYMLTVVDLMLSGGGIIELPNGSSMQVPALELGNSVGTVRELINASNSLFEQVRAELGVFEKEQSERENEQRAESLKLDPEYMIAAFALDVLGWSEEKVRQRLGFDVKQEASSTEYLISRVEESGGA